MNSGVQLLSCLRERQHLRLSLNAMNSGVQPNSKTIDLAVGDGLNAMNSGVQPITTAGDDVEGVEV